MSVFEYMDNFMDESETDLSAVSDTAWATQSETSLRYLSTTVFASKSDPGLEILDENTPRLRFPRWISTPVKDTIEPPEPVEFKNRPPLDGDLNPPNPSLLHILPRPIRFKIFMYVPTRDRARLQLVCRLFRFEIRCRCGVVAFIDDNTSWGLSFLRDIICDTIVVGKYQHPRMTPNQLVFRPFYLQFLTFRGPISMQFMDSFIGRCTRIIRLSISGSVVERGPFLPNSRHKDSKAWRKVESIRRFPRKLARCYELDISPTGRQPSFTVHYVLSLCNFEYLNRVAIKITDELRSDEVRRVHLAVFDLLKKAPQIQHVIVNAMVIPAEQILLTRRTLLRPEKEIIKVSKSVQLRELCLTEEVVNFCTWNKFLSEQKKLEILQVLHISYFPTMYPVLKNNLTTLTKIGLHLILQYHNSGRKNDMFLDLTIFGDCPKLKEMFICVGGPYHTGTTDLTNFGHLPATLEVLAIRNATFNSRDFINLARLPRLKSLGVITHAGTGLHTHNITSRLLYRMLHIRTLEELLIQGFTLSEHAVREVYIMGKLTSSLTKGYSNTFYIRDKAQPDSNKWKTGGKDEYLFRISDADLFKG